VVSVPLGISDDPANGRRIVLIDSATQREGE
jgi:hypothetical protein